MARTCTYGFKRLSSFSILNFEFKFHLNIVTLPSPQPVIVSQVSRKLFPAHVLQQRSHTTTYEWSGVVWYGVAWHVLEWVQGDSKANKFCQILNSFVWTFGFPNLPAKINSILIPPPPPCNFGTSVQIKNVKMNWMANEWMEFFLFLINFCYKVFHFQRNASILLFRHPYN